MSLIELNKQNSFDSCLLSSLTYVDLISLILNYFYHLNSFILIIIYSTHLNFNEI